MDYPLTEDQIAAFRENGFVQLLHVLTAAELEETRAALEDASQLALDARHHTSASNPEYEKVFVQKVNLWTVHAGMRRCVLRPKLAEIARRLAGVERIRLWHDHALIKMPGDSRPSEWHQDLPYWPMREAGALSCWLALDDVDERNGCMQFVPGSHRWGRFEPIRLVGDTQDIFSFVSEELRGTATPQVMRVPAGSCTFHDGLTFHYASANQTDRPRRALVIIYMPDGTTYNGRPHVVTDGLGLKPGEAIGGDLFPLLAQAPSGRSA